MTKYAFNFGAILGFILIIIDFIALSLDMNDSPIFSILGYAIMAIGLAMGIKKYRDSSFMNGFISYGQSLRLGALISIAVAILLAVFSFVYFKFIDDSFLIEMRDTQIEQFYADENLTDEQIEMQVSIFEKFTSPGMLSVFTFFGEFIVGIIMSLIISIFMKNEEPFFTEEG